MTTETHVHFWLPFRYEGGDWHEPRISPRMTHAQADAYEAHYDRLDVSAGQRQEYPDGQCAWCRGAQLAVAIRDAFERGVVPGQAVEASAESLDYEQQVALHQAEAILAEKRRGQ